MGYAKPHGAVSGTQVQHHSSVIGHTPNMGEDAMDRSTKATDTFDKGFNCSQSVLTAFSGELGLGEQEALRIACGFGGGMGRTAKTCGAVSGAFMVIGLKYGQTRGDDKASKEKTYALIKQFSDLFAKAYGSVECRELLPHDISTPEGLQSAQEQGLFKTLCPKYVAGAVKILDGIL